MEWPGGKKFAFTIVDDTDFSTVTNTKPIYDLLLGLGFKTTKTIWVYPPLDYYAGGCLQDEAYLDFVLFLKRNGVEIASHGVGSGDYKREAILKGYEIYKQTLGAFPEIHINHSQNKSNLYWGPRRMLFPFSSLVSMTSRTRFSGEQKGSEYFWGDFAKTHINFMRNLTFSDINTLKSDPEMPYKDKGKERYSNFWFSSSDGHTVSEFNDLIAQDNVLRLQQERGCCIVYTHFASGFMDEEGKINPDFRERMEFLSALNGWYVPAGEILKYLLHKKGSRVHASYRYLAALNARWLRDRIIKKIKYNR